MSDYVHAAQQYARQQLVMRPSGKEVIVRKAMCPIHKVLSKADDYIGVTNEGWLFFCRQGAKHQFSAKPDRSAPKKVEDLPAWMEKQRRHRLEGMNRGS